jgi:hypothetical protein
METTGTKEEQTTILCRILAMPMKHWLFILVLVLLFLALYVAVFAGESESPRCDLQSGLAAALNLSQQQCEDIRRVTERFYDDTAGIRNKSVEKCFELKNLTKVPKADQYAVAKTERGLNALEHEFFRRIHQVELDQGRLLGPDQINKMKEMTSEYNLQPSRRRGYERK